jgi:putative colanic acid biosynthesis acetyltransferase WcaF
MKRSVNTNTFTGASFSLQNRLLRVLWQFVYLMLFKYSPRPFHAYRSALLRLFGARIGKGVHVYPKVIIWAPWNLIIEDEVGIANGVNLYSQAVISIGYRAIVSQGTYICTGTHDYTLSGHPLVTAPISIKANAWVAAECFIHPGVTIGEGAVIGARSVVTKNMPEWMVCVGFPCKPLKERVIRDIKD